jgi:hypothetical protein
MGFPSPQWIERAMLKVFFTEIWSSRSSNATACIRGYGSRLASIRATSYTVDMSEHLEVKTCICTLSDLGLSWRAAKVAEPATYEREAHPRCERIGSVKWY